MVTKYMVYVIIFDFYPNSKNLRRDSDRLNTELRNKQKELQNHENSIQETKNRIQKLTFALKEKDQLQATINEFRNDISRLTMEIEVCMFYNRECHSNLFFIHLEN
jgi:chromosome segregation ATPase